MCGILDFQSLQGSATGPDHLVLNHLPFAEDLRVAKFTAFDEKTEYLPSEEQLDAMSELVRSLDLCSGSTAYFHASAGHQLLNEAVAITVATES